MVYSCEAKLEGSLLISFPFQEVLKSIKENNGEFEIISSTLGKTIGDRSFAYFRISSSTKSDFNNLTSKLKELGVSIIKEEEVILKEVEQNGTFPLEFYSTTNYKTLINLHGHWIEVENPEMDCAIQVDTASQKASSVTIGDARKGDLIVCDGPGIRVITLESANEKEKQAFEFMGSDISSERPIELVVSQIADGMRKVKTRGKKILWVVGPAAVHTGGGKYLAELIRNGYVDILFGGNAVAVHDIELALYGTALGVNLKTGIPVEKGHEHHLRAINQIRKVGSIKKAVEESILKSGIMHECVKNNIGFVLAGSIRDDGPLPDVITDCIKAQEAMRKHLKDVELAIMISTMLHSIATGNMLPAYVQTVCVDINPATVTKLVDRGSHQAVGVVTDVLPFLRQIANELCSHTSMPSLSRSS